MAARYAGAATRRRRYVPKARDIKREVANVGKAHHGVQALLDHIDDPIAEIEIQYYLGIYPHEADQSRHHQRARQGQADAQCAARGLVCLRQFKLGRFDFRKDAPAAFEEYGALRG